MPKKTEMDIRDIDIVDIDEEFMEILDDCIIIDNINHSKNDGRTKGKHGRDKQHSTNKKKHSLDQRSCHYHKYEECRSKAAKNGDKMQFLDGEALKTHNGIIYVEHAEKGDKVHRIINYNPVVHERVFQHKMNDETKSQLLLGIDKAKNEAILINMSDISNKAFMSDYFPHNVCIYDRNLFELYVKELSKKAPVKHVYTYTGFNDKYRYVHSGGIISTKAINNTYSQPDIGTLTIQYSKAPKEKCVNCIDRLFELDPGLSLMFLFNLLSLTSSKFGLEAPQFVLLIWGISGSFKSTTCNHIFGIFSEHYNHAPINLKVTTEAAMHRLMPHFRDCVLLLDDAAPSESGNEDTYKKCESITRAIGDATGRSIVGRDGKVAHNKSAGLVAITGEFVPFRSFSDLGRCIMYKLHKNSISPEDLTVVQKEKSIYIRVIIDYISWICDKGKSYVDEIVLLHLQYREDLSEYNKIHKRTPENLSWLFAAFDMFSQFCKEYYSIDKKYLKHWRKIFETAITISMKDQKEYMKEQNEAKVFVETVKKLYAENKHTLVKIEITDKNKKIAPYYTDCIGYFDEKYVYVLTEESYAKTKQWLRRNLDKSYSLPMLDLFNLLLEKRYIIPESASRKKTRLTINGQRINTMKFKRKEFNI